MMFEAFDWIFKFKDFLTQVMSRGDIIEICVVAFMFLAGLFATGVLFYLLLQSPKSNNENTRGDND